MAYFGTSFLQTFFGNPTLKDWSHASKTFTTNGYELMPRYKFLFHVYFTINVGEIPALQAAFGGGTTASIGLMVKTVSPPGFKIDVDTMNQYNRKRLVQSKINYQPVQMTLHDDQSDLVRSMWYNYYNYYYKDASQPYQNVPVQNGLLGPLQTNQSGFGYNSSDIYNARRTTNDWGYVGETYSDGTGATAGAAGGKPPFFKDIKIYALNQKKFAQWVLINPMITEWSTDSFDYNQGGGTMTNTMTVSYETVKFYNGAIGGAQPSGTVAGFADPSHYDIIPSPLGRPGSTQSVFGQAGLVDAGAGIIEDLGALASGQGGLQNVLGAVQKAGSAYNTFKNVNLRSVVNPELNNALNQYTQTALPGQVRQGVGAANGMIFPTPPKGSGA